MNFGAILRNVSGEVEIGRVLLTTSTFFAITTPIIFQSVDMIWKGSHFDVVAWCAAYPGGIAALVSTGVFSIGKKERDIGIARQTVAQPPLSDDTTGQK